MREHMVRATTCMPNGRAFIVAGSFICCCTCAIASGVISGMPLASRFIAAPPAPPAGGCILAAMSSILSSSSGFMFLNMALV